MNRELKILDWLGSVHFPVLAMDARDPFEPLYQKRRYYKLRRARIPAALWPLFPFVGRSRPSLAYRIRVWLKGHGWFR